MSKAQEILILLESSWNFDKSTGWVKNYKYKLRGQVFTNSDWAIYQNGREQAKGKASSEEEAKEQCDKEAEKLYTNRWVQANGRT